MIKDLQSGCQTVISSLISLINGPNLCHGELFPAFSSNHSLP
jgi:hypothetical protein